MENKMHHFMCSKKDPPETKSELKLAHFLLITTQKLMIVFIIN